MSANLGFAAKVTAVAETPHRQDQRSDLLNHYL